MNEQAKGPKLAQPFAARFPWNGPDLPDEISKRELAADWRATCRDYGGTPACEPSQLTWQTAEGGAGWFLIVTGMATR